MSEAPMLRILRSKWHRNFAERQLKLPKLFKGLG